MKNNKQPVGGGAKKILYTLQTAARIGWVKSAKALSAKNTCKACGLGMGGQLGGMTNEAGEFPSVCNKSVQAQSTDIQPPIPEQIFKHSIAEFRELSAYDLEHLGRLGNPLYKAKTAKQFEPVSWDWALNHAVKQFKSTLAARSFFYTSGRSSNEAGFVLQLLARMYGTNNVNNCSYYCHQATGVGLSNTIGTGASTVELADLEGCDLIFVIGANPASNHPRFIHKLKACRDRGGQVVVINPAKEPGLLRFALPKSARSLLAGGSEIASHYLQPRIGGDIAVCKGIAKWILENNAHNQQFIGEHTEGFALFCDDIENTLWSDIEADSSLTQQQIAEVASVYSKAKNAVFAWGMGVTHHRHGVENIEYISNLALLRGMIGRPFAGLLPLRGHSNVQGIGTIGVKPVLSDEIFKRMQSELKVNLVDKQQSPGLDTLACLEAADNNAMDVALIMGGNLYQATPNSAWAAQALDRIACKVYLTTTLNQGHLYGHDNSEAIIFPVLARDEEPQSTTQESMFNFVRLSEGGISRIAEARSEVDILIALAKGIFANDTKINFSFESFKSRQSIRQSIAKIVPGMEGLVDIDAAKKEFHVRNRLMHTPEFKNKNAKGKFVVHPLPRVDVNPEYPMCLMSVRSEGQFNSIIYEQNDSYRDVDQRWAVMLNREDMHALQVKRGDCVDVSSPYGAMPAVTVYPFDLPRGNVMAYYPEANILIGRDRDKRSKTPAFKSVAVKIVRTVSE